MIDIKKEIKAVEAVIEAMADKIIVEEVVPLCEKYGLRYGSGMGVAKFEIKKGHYDIDEDDIEYLEKAEPFMVEAEEKDMADVWPKLYFNPEFRKDFMRVWVLINTQIVQGHEVHQWGVFSKKLPKKYDMIQNQQDRAIRRKVQSEKN